MNSLLSVAVLAVLLAVANSFALKALQKLPHAVKQAPRPFTTPFLRSSSPSDGDASDKRPANINDPTNPAVDSDGYTLYTDPETNETSRVFDSLIKYPNLFTIKIVGANDPDFKPSMISLVNKVSEVKSSSTKVNGKWLSVTVNVMVNNGDDLYKIYEEIDKDPRVKFKF
ncbi:hypothetical protein TrVE_jg14393 [Triparma verrucosa]|uniref:Uncharacterized protein n=2 Tax=Triparma TaxID=722752 RepID=A0A9W7DRC6_9STRA|nr:hypothetical protein TrST_g8208 [Triparma strigata]GMI06828.1 hypothetical protein TrVE_jg14393 [Triparma verrucosa]